MTMARMTTGNAGRDGKRQAFAKEKGVRANLADSILGAFVNRKPQSPAVKSGLESVKDTVKGKK